ncbi:MAG TPA: hypothetical protein DCG54_09730 [Anaerolineae bacterium]|jgi:SPP1 family predicted phage head-tail adaptor|nr:hypothetical protein [Anaerolineae bacterium]
MRLGDSGENGKISNPGELRTKITLESPTIASDAGGAQRKTYTSQGTVWAKWVNAHGQESIQDGALQQFLRATVTIRYRSDVTAGWAVSKGGLRYEIIAPPDDIREKHEYLELQVQQMRGSS